jgi:Glycosyl transferase family 2
VPLGMSQSIAGGTPRLGVIMPCRNEEAMIRRSISSVLAFDYPADRMTLSVVDGLSTDTTKAIVEEIAARDPRVRLLINPDLLPAPALNLAIDSLDCDVVLRVDAHSIYPTDYASRSVAALLETGAQNVGGVWVTVPGAATAAAKAIAFVLAHPFGVGNAEYRTGTRERRWADTVPFGCWRIETLRALGGFTTDIPYGEDDELNGRLRAAGGRILLDPLITSEYVARATLGKFMLMLYRYGRSKPATAVRLGKVTTLRQLVPLIFVLTLAGSTALSLVWSPILVVGGAAMAAHLFVGVSVAARAVMLRRLDLKAALMVPHTLLAGHVAYGMGYFSGLVKQFNPWRL